MLGRIVVLPEYRGRGCGRLAVEAAERWARDLGFQTSALESRVEKTGFYQRLGYHVTDGTVIHGETFDCVRMEKQM